MASLGLGQSELPPAARPPSRSTAGGCPPHRDQQWRPNTKANGPAREARLPALASAGCPNPPVKLATRRCKASVEGTVTPGMCAR